MHVVEEHGLWLLSCHALPAPLSLERHQGPSSGSVAQPLPAMAHRDLLRRQDDADRLPGVLGISVAGAYQPLAFSQVDRRDGPLRPPQAEKLRQWPVISVQWSVKSVVSQCSFLLATDH